MPTPKKNVRNLRLFCWLLRPFTYVYWYIFSSQLLSYVTVSGMKQPCFSPKSSMTQSTVHTYFCLLVCLCEANGFLCLFFSFSLTGLLVKTTVGYIVAAVIWNEDEEVVLIQEAKASCRGTWYLPAGRVEPDESLLVCMI